MFPKAHDLCGLNVWCKPQRWLCISTQRQHGSSWPCSRSASFVRTSEAAAATGTLRRRRLRIFVAVGSKGSELRFGQRPENGAKTRRLAKPLEKPSAALRALQKGSIRRVVLPSFQSHQFRSRMLSQNRCVTSIRRVSALWTGHASLPSTQLRHCSWTPPVSKRRFGHFPKAPLLGHQAFGHSTSKMLSAQWHTETKSSSSSGLWSTFWRADRSQWKSRPVSLVHHWSRCLKKTETFAL